MSNSFSPRTVRFFGLLMLAFVSLVVWSMAADGNLEWQLKRDNPVGNAFSLLGLGILTTLAVCLIVHPQARKGGWLSKLFGILLLLQSVDTLSNLLSPSFPRDMGVWSFAAVLLTWGLVAMWGSWGIAVLKQKKERFVAFPNFELLISDEFEKRPTISSPGSADPVNKKS